MKPDSGLFTKYDQGSLGLVFNKIAFLDIEKRSECGRKKQVLVV